jgi:hypothetical protein
VHHVREIVEAGHHDDRDVAQVRVGLDAVEDGDPVHLGHHDVEQHDVVAGFGEQRERLHAVLGRAHAVSVASRLRESKRRLIGSSSTTRIEPVWRDASKAAPTLLRRCRQRPFPQ